MAAEWISAERRRALAAALVVLTSPVWAAGSAPAREQGVVPLDPISQQAVAEIRAGRPLGYPVGGLDISHHDHRYFAPHWRTEVAAGSHFVYIKATEGTTY